MRPFVAAVVLIGLCVADDKPAASVDFRTVRPDNDSRLAKREDAQTKNVEILNYYQNKGGGYTFMRGQQVEFYSLPYMPTKYTSEYFVLAPQRVSVKRDIWLIGTSTMPFGGQTLFRSQMRAVPGARTLLRVDTEIARWTRDTPDGPFHLSIIAEDTETRLKLKSIVPVLERAEHGR
jgi:hypothetical protein